MIKCRSCSANVQVNENDRLCKCEYCGASFVNNLYVAPAPVPPISVPAAPRIHSRTVVAPPKPRIKLLPLVFLSVCFWPLGIVYFLHKSMKIQEWKRKYE